MSVKCPKCGEPINLTITVVIPKDMKQETVELQEPQCSNWHGWKKTQRGEWLGLCTVELFGEKKNHWIHPTKTENCKKEICGQWKPKET